ncbi:sugar ABC transporter substrate-binding protein [Haliovirga abyssi]|uniref:Maltose ABC transporter substrate-binding protein n=1 Tax=Haliovirga abyssi TaxID=2996794 RepID=A0AAU9DB82_9FUSO|nr:maltose ABC transporter substrate-binding protein [Haliovirga abyssi]BDU49442.1 maltose ABC transporter substrate-binding protein [Haliovirga abyssi]
MKKRVLVILALFTLVFSSVVSAKTVKLWYGWTGQEKEAMLGILAKYEQVSGNKVDALMVPFDALQGKFQTMAPQGQGPDVIVGPADWIGTFKIQNLLAPIDGFASESTLKGFIPTVLGACKYENKLYGLPESYKVVALIYNKDLIPNPPKTTEEMIKIGKELTNEDESQYGLVYDKGNYYYHMGWIGGFGGKILDKNNNPTFDSKAQIEAAKFVASLSEDPQKIMPEEVDYNVMMTLFNDGLAGMIINGPWAIGDLVESGVNFGVTRIPMVNQTGLWPAPALGPEVMMMSAYSKDKKNGYDLIKFLTSADSQAEMSKVGHLPSRSEVYEYRTVKNSSVYQYIKGFKSQAEVGTPMPTAPEMNAAVWANGATMLSQVLSGDATAEEAAKDVQEKAMESVKELRQK